MVPCLVPADLPTAMLSDLAVKLLETVDALAECRTKHAELIDWVNRGNREESKGRKESDGP